MFFRSMTHLFSVTLDAQCQHTEAHEVVKQPPVKETSDRDSGPGDFALCCLAFDICASVDLDLDDREILSWCIIQITEPLNVNHYTTTYRELRTHPPNSERIMRLTPASMAASVRTRVFRVRFGKSPKVRTTASCSRKASTRA